VGFRLVPTLCGVYNKQTNKQTCHNIVKDETSLRREEGHVDLATPMAVSHLPGSVYHCRLKGEFCGHREHCQLRLDVPAAMIVFHPFGDLGGSRLEEKQPENE
jgi:hypothetical protein